MHVFTRMGGRTGSIQFRVHYREYLFFQPGFINAVLLSSCSLCILGRRPAIARGAALLLRITLLCTQAFTVIWCLLDYGAVGKAETKTDRLHRAKVAHRSSADVPWL